MSRGRVRQAHAQFVPDSAPRHDRHELAERALFLIGLVAIPFAIAVLPQ